MEPAGVEGDRERLARSQQALAHDPADRAGRSRSASGAPAGVGEEKRSVTGRPEAGVAPMIANGRLPGGYNRRSARAR